MLDRHGVEITNATKRCGACQGLFERCRHGNITQEIAEVVRNGKHIVIHVSCMAEGEQVA